MKKTMKFIGIAGMLITVICIFASCSFLNYSGTYYFESMSYKESGIEYNVKVGETYFGAISISEDFMIVSLEKNGNATIKLSTEGTPTISGQWEKIGRGEITITLNGEKDTFKCNGKKLIIDLDGYTYTLKRKLFG